MWLGGLVVMRRVMVAGALACLAGCQSYEAKPLDLDAHVQEWAARSIDSQSVREYAEALAAPVELEAGDASTLARPEAEIIAMVFNGDLRSRRAAAATALAAAEHAGLWDDPGLSLDVLRITESVPDPWVIGGMVGFTIPLSGRLPVEKALANAEHELALRRVAEAEWEVIAGLRSAWARWSAARLRSDLLREFIARVEAIVGIVERLEEAQAISRLEARLFRMELASRRSELVAAEASAAELELEVKSIMGLTPDAAVELDPDLAGDEIGVLEDAIAALDARNPGVAVTRAAYEVAEQRFHLEIRKQYPDLQIGPAYEWDEGQNKIGLGAGLPLPLFNANRQGIAAAAAAREAARIEHEAALERAVSKHRQAEQRHGASAAARSMIERELLPLAEAQIEDERRLAELGELNVLLTLESLVRANETKAQLIEARLAEVLAAGQVRELRGPEPRVRPEEAHP
jgi:outer membrane protein TolC